MRTIYEKYSYRLFDDSIIIYAPNTETFDEKHALHIIKDVQEPTKEMRRTAQTWIDKHILDNMPIPAMSDLAWIPLTERYPDDSRMVFIRKGNNITTAHWFTKTLRFDHTSESWVEDGPMWANQHYTLLGSYIDNPTHWMDIDNLLAIPLKGTEGVTNVD
jgi:hypothetical protein